MGDGLIVAVPQFLAVPNRYPITQESVSQIIAQCVCFYGFGGGWWFMSQLTTVGRKYSAFSGFSASIRSKS